MLAPDTEQGVGKAKVSSSRDGLTWTTHEAAAPWVGPDTMGGFPGIGAFTTDSYPETSAFSAQDRVFLCATIFAPNFTFGMWYSDDLESWVKAPPLDLPQQQENAVVGCMDADPQGHVWAACRSLANDRDDATFRLFKTEDLKTWIEMPQVAYRVADRYAVGQSLIWIGDTMWLTVSGSDDAGHTTTAVFTGTGDGPLTRVDGLNLAGKPGASMVAIGDDLATVVDNSGTAKPSTPGACQYPLALTRIHPDRTVSTQAPQADAPMLMTHALIPTAQLATLHGVIFVDTAGRTSAGDGDPSALKPLEDGIWMYCPSTETAKQ